MWSCWMGSIELFVPGHDGCGNSGWCLIDVGLLLDIWVSLCFMSCRRNLQDTLFQARHVYALDAVLS
jgi:hypothetical protein